MLGYAAPRGGFGPNAFGIILHACEFSMRDEMGGCGACSIFIQDTSFSTIFNIAFVTAFMRLCICIITYIMYLYIITYIIMNNMYVFMCVCMCVCTFVYIYISCVCVCVCVCVLYVCCVCVYKPRKSRSTQSIVDMYRSPQKLVVMYFIILYRILFVYLSLVTLMNAATRRLSHPRYLLMPVK
jgi:hypothetical protein